MPELLNHGDAQKVIRNRITRFAELLELPAKRILDWCFVQSVLSWVWAIDDGRNAGYFEYLVKIFYTMPFNE